MIVHVCASNGEPIGQFEENDFRDNLLAGRFPAGSHYWHHGMEDWRPIDDYRALAKTQRISFAPPRRRTIKIDMGSLPRSDAPKTGGPFTRLWRRLTGGR